LLALAVGGMDIDDLASAKVVSKKAGVVGLLEPKARLRRDSESSLTGVRPEGSSFEYTIDAVDTALYIAEVDGMQAAKRFLDRHGFVSDAAFISTVRGLVNSIPRTKVRGEWIVPEAGRLDTICTLYFPDIELPLEDAVVQGVPEQSALFGDD
jgi:hypothetical protein